MRVLLLAPHAHKTGNVGAVSIVIVNIPRLDCKARPTNGLRNLAWMGGLPALDWSRPVDLIRTGQSTKQTLIIGTDV